MLDPSARTLYSDVLTPPLGYRFDRALATTFSLDLTILLSVPLHLTLFAGERPQRELLGDGVALLEALRRTADQILVFCQHGRIHTPDMPRALYTLLEPLIVEAQSPRPGGIFHPKLWLLRFVTDDAQPVYRLVVLSRNLTCDNSWDLSYSSDGRPSKSAVRGNAPLVELILQLPRLAVRKSGKQVAEVVDRWADEIASITWELPTGFSQLEFHAIGVKNQAWFPPESDALAVVSPFIGADALAALRDTTAAGRVLVSSTEALADVDADTLRAFEAIKVLDDAAAFELAEDDVLESGTQSQPMGLHAKAYICHRGQDTHLFVGSANATMAGLSGNLNVELLAELVGRSTDVGTIDELLGPDGFGEVLTDYSPAEVEAPDPAQEQAERNLERAIRELLNADLRLTCAQQEPGRWSVTLAAARSPTLTGVGTFRVWPVTLPSGTGSVDGLPLSQGQLVELHPCALQSVTSLLAVELTAESVEVVRRFVLNVSLEGVDPGERSAAVLQSVIRDQEGFLRYLLLLLSDLGESGPDDSTGGIWRGAGFGTGAFMANGQPVLEEMVRALCRDPDRLRSVGTLVADLRDGNNEGVVPERFLRLWDVFAGALESPE